MSNRQIRRVNLSLHLSPERSRADLRAMLQLKKWYGAVQRDGSDVNDANMEIRQFHRNIYLSGLQLHLLNPQLCSHVAESLSREGLSLESLCAELQESNLLPVALMTGDGDAEKEKDFSEQQLAQMCTLMAQTLQKQQVAAAPSDNTQHEETAKLREEVAQLKVLLEQQHLLLQQLRVTGRTSAAEPAKSVNAEEVDLSTVDAPTQKMSKVRQKGIF